jgi:hypothetical protein
LYIYDVNKMLAVMLKNDTDSDKDRIK